MNVEYLKNHPKYGFPKMKKSDAEIENWKLPEFTQYINYLIFYYGYDSILRWYQNNLRGQVLVIKLTYTFIVA